MTATFKNRTFLTQSAVAKNLMWWYIFCYWKEGMSSFSWDLLFPWLFVLWAYLGAMCNPEFSWFRLESIVLVHMWQGHLKRIFQPLRGPEIEGGKALAWSWSPSQSMMYQNKQPSSLESFISDTGMLLSRHLVEVLVVCKFSEHIRK